MLGSFGAGRARLEAGDGPGLVVEDAGGIAIRSLTLTGSGAMKNRANGLRVVNHLPGGRRLRFVEIDDVEVSGFGRQGILIAGEAADGSPSGFEEVRITRADLHHNLYGGLLISGPSRPRGYAHARVYVGHCRAHDNSGDPSFLENHSGDGILIGQVDGALIERNVAFGNGALCNNKGGGPVGIWAYASNAVLLQHNESHHNRTGAASVDGGGFDFDGGVSNSVMQDNYSHDNDGAGLMVYAYPDAPFSVSNNVVRFNLSENDGRHKTYAGIFVGADGNRVTGTEVYNNTVFVSPAGPASPRALWIYGDVEVRLRNNLFVSRGGAALVVADGKSARVELRGNPYWPEAGGRFVAEWAGRRHASLAAFRFATGQEQEGGQPLGFDVDPQLSATGAGITVGDPDALERLQGYRLAPTSPLIDRGLAVAMPGGGPAPHDLFGGPFPRGGAPDVGAHEAR